MIIRRVELDNVVSHRHSVVEFPERGVTAIIGRNGAGKTSIIDGITYAVFGVHSRGQRRGQEKAPLIRLGAPEARVAVDFTVDGVAYRVLRRVPRSGSTTALLYRVEDGGRLRLLAQGARPVEAELRRILGLDLRLAHRLYVTRQGELEDILVEKDKRERLITSLLRLEEIEKAANALSTARRVLDIRLRGVEERLRDYSRRLEDLRRLQREAGEHRARLRELEPLLSSAEELEEARRLLEQAERLRLEAEKLRAEVEQARAEAAEAEELGRLREEAEELRSRVEALEEQAKRYIELSNTLRNIEAELEAKRREISRLERRIREKLASTIASSLEVEPSRAVERLQGLLEMLEERLRRIRARADALREERGDLRARIREIEDNLDKLSSARGVCPLCRQRLSDEHRRSLIRRLREEKQRLEQRLAEVEKRLAMLEDEQRQLEERRRQLQALLEAVRNDQARLVSLLEDVESLEGRRGELRQEYLMAYAAHQEYREARERLAEIEKGLERLREIERRLAVAERLEQQLREKLEEARALEERAAEILGRHGVPREGLEERLEELRRLREEAARLQVLSERLEPARREAERLSREVRELEAQLAEARRDAEKLEELQRRLEEAEARLAEARSRLEALRAEAERLRGRLEEAEKELAKLPAVEEAYKRLSGQAEALRRALRAAETLAKFFRDTLPRAVQATARATIEAHLREILYSFNLNLTDVRLEDDYEPVVVSREGEKTVHMLSGGERVALAIAYRLAVARAVGGRIGVLVMDEPTVHLDEERKRELINIIKQGLWSTGLRQLIVVTHDQELEEAADQVIEVVNVDGSSRVTVRAPGAEQLGGGDPAVTA